MNYQRVLQWSCGSRSEDFDRLIEIEELSLRRLPAGTKVAGHDIGSGKANIFILTNDPVSSFQQVRSVLESSAIWQAIRTAYRETEREKYIVVWPKGLTEFPVI